MSKKLLPPLHLACSDDDLRPALNHIEVVDGIATATNAHVIAQLKLSEYSDLDPDTIRELSGKLIHKDVWKTIMDADVLSIKGDIIHCVKGGINADFNIATELRFPDHKSIIDAVAKSIFEKKSFVCFNPEWIKIASKIFPSESLICRFYENHEMMVFFPSGDAKGFVGIMPMQITDEEATIDFSLT